MRKATKQKRLDLWLDEADMARLTELADGWAISRQRVIESALTYATATAIDPSAGDQYARSQRIPLNLDGLALAQVEHLAESGVEASAGIRAAIRAFYAARERQNAL